MHFPQFLIIWICMQALHLLVSFCVFCDFYLDQGVCGSVVFRVQSLTIGLDPTWKPVLGSFTQVPLTGKLLFLAKVFSFPLFFPFLLSFSIICHRFPLFVPFNFPGLSMKKHPASKFFPLLQLCMFVSLIFAFIWKVLILFEIAHMIKHTTSKITFYYLFVHMIHFLLYVSGFYGNTYWIYI